MSRSISSSSQSRRSASEENTGKDLRGQDSEFDHRELRGQDSTDFDRDDRSSLGMVYHVTPNQGGYHEPYTLAIDDRFTGVGNIGETVDAEDESIKVERSVSEESNEEEENREEEEEFDHEDISSLGMVYHLRPDQSGTYVRRIETNECSSDPYVLAIHDRFTGVGNIRESADGKEESIEVEREEVDNELSPKPSIFNILQGLFEEEIPSAQVSF